jgi:uncharacterized membrane protein
MTLNTSATSAATSAYSNLSVGNNAYGIDSNWTTIINPQLTKSDVEGIVNEVLDKKTPEVRPDTVTKLDVKHGKLCVKHYKDGFFKNEHYLIPDITDVKVHHNTVLVTFKDGTKTVAVLDDEDKFNLEQGISICITKKLLGENGSSIYNKLIKRALKVKKQNEQAEAKKEKDKAEAEQKKAKALKRHQKKQAKKREERISEMAEAYIRAIEHFKENI